MTKDGDRDKPNPLAPHPLLGTYYERAADRDAFVRSLFDRSARHYDRINRLFSLGLGNWYRRRSLQRAGLQSGMRVLDAAIGTGAIARQVLVIQGTGAEVIGLDVSEGMLAEARRDLDIPLVLGRLEELPIADSSFDFYAVGYALRHAADLDRMFAEARRVLPRWHLVGARDRRAADVAAPLHHPAVPGQGHPRLAALVCRSQDARQLMQYYWDTIINCVPESAILQSMLRAGLPSRAARSNSGSFAPMSASEATEGQREVDDAIPAMGARTVASRRPLSVSPLSSARSRRSPRPAAANLVDAFGAETDGRGGWQWQTMAAFLSRVRTSCLLQGNPS